MSVPVLQVSDLISAREGQPKLVGKARELRHERYIDRNQIVVQKGGAMDVKCPVTVDGQPCGGNVVKHEVEDNRLGRIEVYVCEQGHRAFFAPRERSQSSSNS